MDLGNGHPISKDAANGNCWLTIDAGLGKYLNLTKFWVVAGTTQNLRWQTDSIIGAPGAGAQHYEVALSDSMTGVDALSVSLIPGNRYFGYREK